MKKKGPKSIPDFSKKRKEKPIQGAEDVKAHAPVTTKNIKPPALTSKAGRRGG